MATGRLQLVLRRGFYVALTLVFSSVTEGQELEELFEPFQETWLSLDQMRNSADSDESFETDRDSYTPSTSTVAISRVVFESAFSYLDFGRAGDLQSYPEIIARIGITSRTELRIGWNREVIGFGSVTGGDASELAASRAGDSVEESQMLYGIKSLLTEQNSWIPQSSFIAHGFTPTSGPETASDFMLGYVFGWKILNDWTLDSSLRYRNSTKEGDHFNHWAPSVVLKVPIGERWSMHGEYFGLFSDGRAEEKAEQYFSPGVNYMVTPDLEVGVRVGRGLSEHAADYFVNVGFGLRI